MKKIIISFFFLSMGAFLLSACRDESKNPFPINGDDGPFGAFIVIDEITSAIIDFTDLANSQFEANLRDPAGTVASYDLSVRLLRGGVEVEPFAFLKSITSFPATLTVNAGEVAAALGITTADFQEGDVLGFEAEMVHKNGTVFTVDDINAELFGNPGQRQGVTFQAYIACPSTIEGVYSAHTDWIDYYGVPSSFDYETEITRVDAVGYNLADLSGGMEPIRWGNPEVAAVIFDICGTVFLSSAPYGYGYFIDGPSNSFGAGSSIDSGTGVITIY